MDRFLPLLLGVWQQACRNIRIDASAEAIAAVLARRLPLDHLLIRQLDPARAQLAMLAWTGQHAPPSTAETTSPGVELEPLIAWCGTRQVVRGPAETVTRRLPGLLPAGLCGNILAGGLVLEGQVLGAAILATEQPGRFSQEHEPMLAALLDPLAVAVQNDRLVRELTALREAAEADRAKLLARLGRQDITDPIVGAEGGLREVMHRVELVARADTPVLILGETGSGKEVVARAIHGRSPRASGPFLRVNCGAIPPELADSELFGHERGSFTGAAAQRKGWFERADGGTLFLDEVGELSPAIQVRLLRILQDGTFQRVGGERQLRVDVRVVAATHRDLGAMVGAGQFRADLWYRINVFPIDLPALRERPQDIPAMATSFALRAAARLGLPPRLPTPEDMERLLAYPWPGNVRELAAVIERAAILGNGRALEVPTALGGNAATPAVAASDPATTPARTPAQKSEETRDDTGETLDEVVRRRIEAALADCLGRIEGPFGAARRLGVNPHTLRARMRRLGIDWTRFRPLRP
ncbi:transcriptional regulator containing GAF, AAA-type ATPase, and DNA binding domains [Thioflavicoccus mobilis 8321]|uniref:Transcriptional regulator containing GAF, AAA-type ATPase, and DNA binding domains n=1 Tax=Thioflavicoccus mobilis 8321 TaxID=765912 RepID=L0GTA4_9GAMM|nr:sigma 54-interacting transcriptional regulator [Thioflavicoccus mobilis]AGA89241.1 transcriptional regulator containing GAF, AAA-type ATPase, and DNA binding domains [Thioflavicoccus mobilis 8321]